MSQVAADGRPTGTMAIPYLVEPEPAWPQRVLRCTAEDAARLVAHLPPGVVERELPGSHEHAYLDERIVKPWGHEMRVYDDRWIDVWELRVEAGGGTSLHAHLRKDTCLVCAAGAGVLATGAGRRIALAEGDVVHIGAGVLHASFSEAGMTLIEVETPRDKLDLVRVDDRYGRTGQAYADGRASRQERCPLLAHPDAAAHARLRRQGSSGVLRLGLETADHIRRAPRGVVARSPSMPDRRSTAS